jgi:tRNA threonylcarbamoyladenosine modification (KEOPS) complex  Pcc1 subunit
MYANKNYISLSFRADDEDTRDTDMNVSIDIENADDAKLLKTLNRWLRAIEADLVVQDTRNK